MAFCSVSGEMVEWSKAHAWKACVAQATGGSNPPLSAINMQCRFDRLADFAYSGFSEFSSTIILWWIQ